MNVVRLYVRKPIKTNLSWPYLVLFKYQQYHSTASNPTVSFSYQNCDVHDYAFKETWNPRLKIHCCSIILITKSLIYNICGGNNHPGMVSQIKVSNMAGLICKISSSASTTISLREGLLNILRWKIRSKTPVFMHPHWLSFLFVWSPWKIHTVEKIL